MEMRAAQSLTLSGEKLGRLAGFLMCGLTFSNVLFACFDTVDCEDYLPSISYIAAFPGHDRMAVATSVFYALVLTVLFSGVFAKERSEDRGLMLGIGMGISTLVPIVAIVDGHTGLYGVGMSNMHYFALYFLVVLTLIWLCLALPTMSKRLPILKWSLTVVVLLVLTLVEWQLCSSSYQGLLFNQTLFALSQWSTVAVAVFLPAKVCEAYGDFEVYFELDTI